MKSQRSRNRNQSNDNFDENENYLQYEDDNMTEEYTGLGYDISESDV